MPVKVILLCRTDIFEIIGGPNKNKIRQDSGFELNWYPNARDPRKSKLVEIANKRSALSISLGERVDIFDTLLPQRIFQSSLLNVILDCTRHTPRDFLQVLTYIQKTTNRDKPTDDEVKAGLRRYSHEYFLPEILDELAGYADPSEVKELFRLIGDTRSRDFRAKDIMVAHQKYKSKLDVDKIDVILHALFECSAIGNVTVMEGAGGRSKYTMLSYKYRNRHVSFIKDNRIILHRGLWRALNLPESGYRAG